MNAAKLITRVPDATPRSADVAQPIRDKKLRSRTSILNSPTPTGIKRPVLFKRVAKVAIILAVALSIGLHWVLLQSVAWTGMFVSFAQETTLSEAFSKTFDGKNPCRICKLVRDGQQSEKARESVLPLVKIESLPSSAAFVLLPPAPLSLLPDTDEAASPRAESPPLPPPRAA